MGDNISSTTPAVLFTGCVTAEAGSTNPFLSFGNHYYMNLSVSAANANHDHKYRGHCTKCTSNANGNVQGVHKVPNLLLICFGPIKQNLLHHICGLLTSEVLQQLRSSSQKEGSFQKWFHSQHGIHQTAGPWWYRLCPPEKEISTLFSDFCIIISISLVLARSLHLINN